jgi:hypothetical protein
MVQAYVYLDTVHARTVHVKKACPKGVPHEIVAARVEICTHDHLSQQHLYTIIRAWHLRASGRFAINPYKHPTSSDGLAEKCLL